MTTYSIRQKPFSKSPSDLTPPVRWLWDSYSYCPADRI